MNRAQYFTLGHSGLRVSRLALGTMTFEHAVNADGDELSRRQAAHLSPDWTRSGSGAPRRPRLTFYDCPRIRRNFLMRK